MQYYTASNILCVTNMPRNPVIARILSPITIYSRNAAMNLIISVSPWYTQDSGFGKWAEGTKSRRITFDMVMCEQTIFVDGTKHYEFFNKHTNRLISGFSSPEMQAVEKILYYIQHEDEFRDA